ncbi:hypothetical protein, partial [Neobacillus drentensis]|uniref:hypothetical protein n=1 Tax=Neobacillus drentensis TaxID=220684 RepID=UPI003001EB12
HGVHHDAQSRDSPHGVHRDARRRAHRNVLPSYKYISFFVDNKSSFWIPLKLVTFCTVCMITSNEWADEHIYEIRHLI